MLISRNSHPTEIRSKISFTLLWAANMHFIPSASAIADLHHYGAESSPPLSDLKSHKGSMTAQLWSAGDRHVLHSTSSQQNQLQNGWVGRELKDHPAPPPAMGWVPPTRSKPRDPIQSSFERLQGWGTHSSPGSSSTEYYCIKKTLSWFLSQLAFSEPGVLATLQRLHWERRIWRKCHRKLLTSINFLWGFKSLGLGILAIGAVKINI